MSEHRASEGTPSPATPAPSLRELAERTLATGESLRALRAARIGGTTKEYHTADMEARQTFNQAFDAFSEAATPAAIIALSDELESTRSALREAQEDRKQMKSALKQIWIHKADKHVTGIAARALATSPPAAKTTPAPTCLKCRARGVDVVVIGDTCLACAALDAAAGSTT